MSTPKVKVLGVELRLTEFTTKDRKVKGKPHEGVFVKKGELYETVECDPYWILMTPGTNLRGIRGIKGNLDTFGTVSIEGVEIPLEKGLTGKETDAKRNNKLSGEVEAEYNGKLMKFSFLVSQTKPGVVYISATITNIGEGGSNADPIDISDLAAAFAAAE